MVSEYSPTYFHQRFDRRIGFRCSSVHHPCTNFAGREKAVDLRCADGPHTLAQLRAEVSVTPFVERQPQREHRFETFAARLFGVLPDFVDNLSRLCVVRSRSAALGGGGSLRRGESSPPRKQLGGILTFVLSDLTKLV